MRLSLTQSELKQYLSSQLGNFFPDKYHFSGSDVDVAMETALDRTEYCFKHINQPYYWEDGHVCFNHLHSDQYCSFIYFLSNSLWKESQNKPLCDKLLLLNRAINSVFISYKCNLPDIFLFDHAIGSVIGNAVYSNFLVVLQHVTINTGDHTGIWNPPHLGTGVFLGAGVTIVGSGRIGNFSSVGVNSIIFNRDIPGDSVIYTDEDGMLKVKSNKDLCYAQKFFNVDIRKTLI